MENPKSYNCGAANSSNTTQQMALPAQTGNNERPSIIIVEVLG
jgi:hypothetical protein